MRFALKGTSLGNGLGDGWDRMLCEALLCWDGQSIHRVSATLIYPHVSVLEVLVITAFRDPSWTKDLKALVHVPQSHTHAIKPW